MADFEFGFGEGELYSTPPTGSTTSYNDSTAGRAAINVAVSQIDMPSTTTKLYVTGKLGALNTSSNSYGRILEFRSGATVLARLYGAPNLYQVYIQGLVGSVLTNSATTPFSFETTLSPYFTLFLDTAAGVCKLLVNYQEVLTMSVDASSALMDNVEVGNVVTTAYYSQLMFSTVPMLQAKLISKEPTGEGTETGGVGAYTDIDDIIPDTAGVSFDTAGQRRSVLSNNTRTIENSVRGFIVTATAGRSDDLGPQQIRPFVKISGTIYYGPTFPLTTSTEGYYHNFATNPATAQPWTNVQLSDPAFEYGWEAVA